MVLSFAELLAHKKIFVACADPLGAPPGAATMTDTAPLISLGACMGGPVVPLLADGEEVVECILCRVVLPADVADGPFLGWAAWCEKGVQCRS
jgi:hypothetical protein